VRTFADLLERGEHGLPLGLAQPLRCGANNSRRRGQQLSEQQQTKAAVRGEKMARVVTLAKRERERSTRKQAATMSVVTVATDQVGVSASDRPCSAAIRLPARPVPFRPSLLSSPPPSLPALLCSESFCCGFARWDYWDLEAAR